MPFTSASSPCIACPSLPVSTTLQSSGLCLTTHSRKVLPHQLDPPLQGPMVLNVMLTAIQDFGGPQTSLSDSGSLLQLSEPFCSTVYGMHRLCLTMVTSQWLERKPRSAAFQLQHGHKGHPDLMTWLSSNPECPDSAVMPCMSSQRQPGPWDGGQ